MLLVDTHAHLTDPSLLEQIDAVLERARDVGVSRMIAVGTTATTSAACCRLAEQHSMIFAAVGIHPNYVHEAAESDWGEILRLSGHDRVRAIGETGLDDYWKDAPMPLQQDYFQRHLQLSRESGLPFIVHMRECEDLVLRELTTAYERYGALRGVLHSFAGDWSMAEACLKMGLFISFSGMITYKKNDALREVACKVPLDRLLIETDCPYLSPEPNRGRRPNEPAWVLHTAHTLAKVHGVSTVRMAAQTSENAESLFRL